MNIKKCRVCKAIFTPARPLQSVCSHECAITKATIARSKAERIEAQESRKTIRLQKDKLKTKGEHAREAQAAFNAFIRERDKAEPCISCGRFHSGQYHAGHYRSVGSHHELRFEELNVHKQCSVCNNHKSGNVIEYRINLVAKIGQKALDWLEGHHEPKKYTVEELKAIKSTYKAKLKELKA